MATHILVVRDAKEFHAATKRLGINGEGQEKAICVFGDGSNLHHGMAFRPPLIVHTVEPMAQCHRLVQKAIQTWEALGAEVRA